MTKSSQFARAAVLALVVGLFVAPSGPAHAAATTLYVNHNNTSAACSDSGTGTAEQPYCTIAAAFAAVQAGQIVQITGVYDENVTLTKSGTPESPIRIVGGTLKGADARLTVDGQHDVRIESISINETASGAALTVTRSHDVKVFGFTANLSTGVLGMSLIDSSALTIRRSSSARYNQPDGNAAGYRLVGVTDSLLDQPRTLGRIEPSLTMDAATHGVTVNQPLFENVTGAGVIIGGTDNTVANGFYHWVRGTAIQLTSSAARNVLVNNRIWNALGGGIDNAGASGTIITNNSVQGTCSAGIRIASGSRGVSVQNNISSANGNDDNGRGFFTTCDPARTDRAQIAVLGDATLDTIVDYNYVSAGVLYGWGQTTGFASSADFAALTGQATHDLSPDMANATTQDNANSAAPGWPSTDYYGVQRLDDIRYANTGAGPVSYADRGAEELYQAPTAHVTAVGSGWGVCADASTSTSGSFPIVSYVFDFGDGAKVAQGSPKASHIYRTSGTKYITVTAVDSRGASYPSMAATVVLKGRFPYRPTCSATLPRR